MNLTSIALLGIALLAVQDDAPVNEALRREAEALSNQAKSALGRELLQAVEHLPAAEARTIYRDPDTRRYLAGEQREQLSPAEGAALEEVSLDAERFYTTKYGSPLAYLRPIEILAEAGWSSFDGKRILDFGYGTIGHLRLLALNGADVVGVDVDSFLTALYGEEDQGKVEGPKHTGSVRLVEGRWPTEDDTREAVGAGFDLFLSKNTLKRGYVHPEREADPRHLIHLGVSDEEYVRRVFEALRSGGLVVIYNLCPKPSSPDEPYVPWADGRCPWSRELLEKTGFEVVHFDRDDSEAARRQGRTLGWETPQNDLDESLFAWVTVLRKPE